MLLPLPLLMLMLLLLPHGNMVILTRDLIILMFTACALQVLGCRPCGAALCGHAAGLPGTHDPGQTAGKRCRTMIQDSCMIQQG
jgi:hypothetical protein